MSHILSLNSIKDTRLWQHLNTGFADPADQTVARHLTSATDALCAEAADRMKRMPSPHPEFTLHDQTHLLRVTELMALVLGNVIRNLNPVEIALLILGAHFHDQGMVPDASDLADLEASAEFQTHRDTWAVEHPNQKEIENRSRDPNLTDRERDQLAFMLSELRHAMRGEFIRGTHGQRSGSFIRKCYAEDPRLQVQGVTLAEFLAILCESHMLPAENLTPQGGLEHDQLIGTYSVNLRYLAVVLRLADILDFDRDRTPDALYRTIHFTSDVSLAEWEKHRAVHGWTIRRGLIRFDMRFEHPIYERTAREFLDRVDDELVSAHEIVRSFPNEFASRYPLDIPQRVDRSRVGPKKDAYIYHDLEFSLSRDEIVKLLMMDALYESPSLAVRELIQNSLDALRYRTALFKTANVDWPGGGIDLEHSVDQHGYEVIRCTDDGVGMDEQIITRFLTKAGRSYYRSPEFELERARFRAADADFDPCSQFGIGFMSCFMVGDRIRVETRRDYGPGRKYGRPLVIEINGLGGIVTLREGDRSQPVGTTVTITARNKPAFMDEWVDTIRLTRFVEAFALAVEYPIRARCTIPEIASEVAVPPELAPCRTLLEDVGVTQCVTIEQSLSEIDHRLRGCVRESFLVDDNGVPTLRNRQAQWDLKVQNGKRAIRLMTPEHGVHKPAGGRERGQTCVDGIYVCGQPGRGSAEVRFGSVGNYVTIASPFVLDVRGSLKPKLTPARSPPSYSLFGEPSWNRLDALARRAGGRLWADFIRMLPLGFSPAEFWKLCSVHRGDLRAVPCSIIWEQLAVYLGAQADKGEWCPIRSLPRLVFQRAKESYRLETIDGRRVGVPDNVGAWGASGPYRDHECQMAELIIAVSCLVLRKKRPMFQAREPTDPEQAPDDFLLGRSFRRSLYAVPFSGELAPALSAQCDASVVNRDHPLVALAIQARFKDQPGILEGFARSAVPCLAADSTHDAKDPPSAKVTRWMKYVGHLYLSVDWSPSDTSEFHPPYRIWLRERGWVSVTADDFRSWAAAEVQESGP